jgi:hypothetical protein
MKVLVAKAPDEFRKKYLRKRIMIRHTRHIGFFS